VLKQPIESEDVNKYTVKWKVLTVFLVKISGNFPERLEWTSGNFQKFCGGNFRTHNPSYLSLSLHLSGLCCTTSKYHESTCMLVVRLPGQCSALITLVITSASLPSRRLHPRMTGASVRFWFVSLSRGGWILDLDTG